MSRRIEVELTSARDDGTWTWRAAGAKQPKGVLDGALLYEGAKAGDVLRAEVESDLDGTRVLQVTPPKSKSGQREPERLTIIGRGEPEELVTSTLVGRKGRSDRGDRDRGDRPDRGQGRDRKPGGPRGDRPGQDRGGRARPGSEGRDRPDRPGGTSGPGGRSDADKRERRPRPERPAPEPRPRAKRLRPGRAHRKTVLDGLPPEQQPIAEHVLKGGIPAVRQAVEKQNEAAKVEGGPMVPADALVAMAEKLLPALRAAEWMDRAEAALKDLAELDLRDLRSVVAAADTATKDDESRAMAAQLREGLSARVEQEQAAWMAELTSTLTEGRVVRALRLSSRPPKAGVRLPPDLTIRLTEATAAALTEETPQDRWSTVLDALSFSPIHLTVIPQTIPSKPSDDLVSAVRKFADRLPQIAAMFGVEAAPAGSSGRRPPRSRGKGGPPSGRAKPQGAMSGGRPVPPPPSATAPASPVAGTTQADAPVVADMAPGVEPAPPAAAPEAPVEAIADVDATLASAGLPAEVPVDETPVAETPVVQDAAPTPEPAPQADAPEAPAEATVEDVEQVGSITPPAEPSTDESDK